MRLVWEHLAPLGTTAIRPRATEPRRQRCASRNEVARQANRDDKRHHVRQSKLSPAMCFFPSPEHRLLYSVQFSLKLLSWYDLILRMCLLMVSADGVFS